ncbi:GGDEF domain-containing response regulator [Chromobacterium paludis]|uniref:diguanylate cyclase n=1 Tax=Chromobacterium paludis TaxID=2605945 RepID=A0A5C1DJF6_9NEIS|nr:diguanylate cyclase [Chromobacterium paludis]QEL56834.1 diguanylate cyclase [Chromobacterium paludis]
MRLAPDFPPKLAYSQGSRLSQSKEDAVANEVILCVDDDISVLNALRALLSQNLDRHQSIEIAESAEEALELVDALREEGEEVPVVFADYIMPGMKGDELLAEIRQRLPATMNIMLTGQSDLMGVKRAINQAGLYRFIEKPWDNDDLVLTLQTALRTYALDRSLKQQNEALRELNASLEQTVAERTRELQEKNIELARLSVTDKLTGLANRLFLDQSLETYFAESRRHGSVFSLILLDVDHFKGVNDTWGHPAGDRVLKGVAQVLGDRVRQSDVAGRWGGEEFLVICPHTERDGALRVAESLREAIAGHAFADAGPITASFGVASYQAGDTISRLETRADQALYRAKQAGRNRVEAG